MAPALEAAVFAPRILAVGRALGAANLVLIAEHGVDALGQEASAIGGDVIADRAFMRVDLDAWSGVHQPIDDHAVVRAKTRLDHPQPAAQIAGLDRRRHDRAIVRNRHDQVLRLIEHYRGVGHQKGRRGGCEK